MITVEAYTAEILLHGLETKKVPETFATRAEFLAWLQRDQVNPQISLLVLYPEGIQEHFRCSLSDDQRVGRWSSFALLGETEGDLIQWEKDQISSIRDRAEDRCSLKGEKSSVKSEDRRREKASRKLKTIDTPELIRLFQALNPGQPLPPNRAGLIQKISEVRGDESRAQ